MVASTSPQSISSVSSGGGVRDDVMSQIRQGAPLKHVQFWLIFQCFIINLQVDKAEVENSRKSITEMGGIAGALARALEERRKNMRNSDGMHIFVDLYSIQYPL